MMNVEIQLNKVENGYTMRLSYEQDKSWREETYIATTAAKLKKMVNNAIKLVDKEVITNAD
jgi:hypothetical protein